LTQLHKALVQNALDNNSWDAAILLWPMPDPLAFEQFGGTEEEMRRVAGYMKAVDEMKKQRIRSQTYDPSTDADDGAANVPRDKRGNGSKRGGPKGRGRGADATGTPT
jgi:hypothetical protein